MTIFNRILYELATKNVIQKTALINTIGGSPYPVYRQLQKGMKAGLIKEISYTIKASREQVTIDCLILTPDGIRYIKNKLSKEIPWAEYIAKFDSASVIGDKYYLKNVVLRFSKITSAAIMADSIGASESKVFYSDFETMDAEEIAAPDKDKLPPSQSDDELFSEDDETYADLDDPYLTFTPKRREAEKEAPSLAKPTLSKLVSDAMSTYASAKAKLIEMYDVGEKKSTNNITFFDALSIKRAIDTQSREQRVLADVRGGRYSGILDSPIRSCLVYTLVPITPLAWYKRFLERELRALEIIKRMKTGFKHLDEEPNGILLVPDPKTFERTYNAHLYVERPQRMKYLPAARVPECGEKLTHLWVVPFSEDGNAELLSIMTTDMKKEREAIIKTLLATEEYVPNADVSRELFPVKDSFGVLTAIGTHMDVKRMKAIDRMADTNLDATREYAILCFRWQVPYYEAVIHSDNVEIIAMDDDLREFRREWNDVKPKLAIERERELWESLLDAKLTSEKDEKKRREEIDKIVSEILRMKEGKENITSPSQTKPGSNN